MLTETELADFARDGFVAVRGAVPQEIASQCAAEIWAATGCLPDDPATWTEPVVRLWALATEPFIQAANSPRLLEAFDQLVGPGRWSPRMSLGTIPVRFPHPSDPGDDGWHVEASFADETGAMRVDVGSRGRALLMLFLFSEVGEADAPTRIRRGSHQDVPRFLVDAGDEGRDWMEVCGDVVAASADREVTLATGSPGDVYLCHPFLVHAAQPHRGQVPRLMAQPPLEHPTPFDFEDPAPPPVVRTILDSLAR
ncbi:MAG: phytanoyl-CoA dioxygenase family protein [Marmoricola sp.]